MFHSFKDFFRLCSFFFSLFSFCSSETLISILLYSSSPILSSFGQMCLPWIFNVHYCAFQLQKFLGGFFPVHLPPAWDFHVSTYSLDLMISSFSLLNILKPVILFSFFKYYWGPTHGGRQEASVKSKQASGEALFDFLLEAVCWYSRICSYGSWQRRFRWSILKYGHPNGRSFVRVYFGEILHKEVLNDATPQAKHQMQGRSFFLIVD